MHALVLVLLAGLAIVDAESTQKPLLGSTGVLRRFYLDEEHVLSDLLHMVQDNNLDLWNTAPTHLDIYSPPTALALPAVLHALRHNASAVPAHAPISRMLSDAHVNWGLGSLTNTSFHDEYHPLFEIDQFVREITALHPTLAHTSTIGFSAEHRPIAALTISNGKVVRLPAGKRRAKHKKADPTAKLAFVVVGAQHAREWIATAAALYLTHALVANDTEAGSISTLLDHYDFHIVPVPNPDGYEYTWEIDRYWYKNRQVIGPYAKCIGIDMNRNWGYKWKPTADLGATDFHAAVKATPPTDPCSHWYPGQRAFEAPETNALANFVQTLPGLVGFLDLRSYGQMLSSPWSFTCSRLPNDAEDQIEAALGAVRALRNVHGIAFQTGNLCKMLYRAPGNIIDWMFTRAAIKYSYVVHLRDTGTYGFALPEKWIRPVGEETAQMVRYLSQFIRERKGGQM